MKCPCEKECPHRHAECRLHCQAWAAYEAERNAEYERRKKENIIAAGYYEMLVRRSERIRKRFKRG